MRMRADESAFEQLLAVELQALGRLAYVLTGSKSGADDLLQETLLKLWTGRQRLLEATKPHAYCRAALVNAHRDMQRREARFMRNPQLAEIDDEFYARDPSERIANVASLWAALGRLPQQYRDVLVLRYYEDLPDIEIAKCLGITRVGVRSRVHRALRSLRTYVAEEVGG
jgi:RNA polymerase sigma-70 factor (sigma-E family)